DGGRKDDEDPRDDDDDKDADDGNFKNGLFYDERATDEKVSKTDVRVDDEGAGGKKKKGRHSDEHEPPAVVGGKDRKKRSKLVSPEPVIEHAGGADVDPDGADGTAVTSATTGGDDTKDVTGATTTTTSTTEQRKAKVASIKKTPSTPSTPVSPARSPNVSTGQENSARLKLLFGLAGRIAQEKLDVDSLIRRVLMTAIPGHGLTKTVPMAEIMSLIRVARYAFASAPMLVDVEAPINICGDTHGQYGDLLRLFRKGGFPPTSNYLFLGDYVDRGAQNLEVIILLLCYRVAYPGNFVLLRGNHECRQINRIYGFYDEVNRRFGAPLLWNEFQDLFDMMPLCGLVSRRILCMHGGISPKIMNDKWRELIRTIPRPCHPDEGQLAMDLLWSDPVAGNAGFLPNPRGASYGFGEQTVNEFCQLTGIDLIARGHQVVQDGYEFFANRKLVTVFSAPFYCGQFNNCASILCVNEDLQCSFVVMRGHAKLDSPEDPKLPVQDLDTNDPKITEMTTEEMDSKATIHPGT
ncbi:hypothetical protein PENTCL1PPCAC_18421, partial [Pristionchus entomophagus]